MSLKGDKYENLEEIRFRLENSIVMYEDFPVYITGCRIPEADDGKEIARVYFKKLPYNARQGEVRKFLSSRKFSLAIPNLGYANHKGRALYISRIPVRQNRQGLCSATCSITQIDGRRIDKNEDTFAHLIAEDGFADMVRGKYPSFREAMASFNDKDVRSVALSHSFALGIDDDLDTILMYHKNKKCGLAFKGDRTIRLANKFKFMKEELDAIGVPLA